MEMGIAEEYAHKATDRNMTDIKAMPTGEIIRTQSPKTTKFSWRNECLAELGQRRQSANANYNLQKALDDDDMDLAGTN